MQPLAAVLRARLLSARLFPAPLALFAGGALTTLAFAPHDLSFLPFLTFALLFHYWADKTPAQAFRGGFFFGLGLFSVGVGWLHLSIHLFGGMPVVGAILVTMPLVLFLSLYPALAGWLARRLAATGGRDVAVLLAMPAAWTLTEWLRSWAFTGFPWLSLGYTQIDTPLAGYAPLGGVFLVSLLTLTTAAALALIPGGAARRRWSLIGFCLLVFAVGAASQQRDWTRPGGKTLAVALIQGAVPQELKWRREYRDSSLELYLSLTAPHWGKDLIVWPETAIPAYYHQAAPFLNRLERLALRHDTVLLTGLPVKNTDTGEYYNSVLALGGSQRRFYHKRHLVPFGEYTPLGFLLDDLVAALRIPVSDFSAGDSARPPLIDTAKATLGLSICFEDIFGDEIRAALPEAEALINVSNDAWFGDSAAAHQHLQMARMRSVENGRYLARGTNTGVSAVIDEKGRIVARSAQFQASVDAAEIQTFRGHTPYSRWGDYPLLVLLLLMSALASPASRARPFARARRQARNRKA